jgi:hypothetical protein
VPTQHGDAARALLDSREARGFLAANHVECCVSTMVMCAHMAAVWSLCSAPEKTDPVVGDAYVACGKKQKMLHASTKY